MSSVGQAVGGLVGGVIGFFVGNPLYGAQIGMMIGGMLDPPKGPMLTGPRLSDLSVQTSTYGAFIPRNYGTVAQLGNVFWLKGDKITEEKTVTESGGKGGPVTTTTSFSYYATFAVGLCQGPILGVRRIWIGPNLYYDAGGTTVSDILASNKVADKFTLYLGTDTQDPDPLIQADKGVANVPAYRGLAYIVFHKKSLKKYGNNLAGAQVKVEIVKNGTLSDWAIISDDTLTNPMGGELQAVVYSDDTAFYEWTVDSVGTTPTPSIFTLWRVDHSSKVRSVVRSVSADLDETYTYEDGGCRRTCIGYGDVDSLVVPIAGPYGVAVINSLGGATYSNATIDGLNSSACISHYALVDDILAYCITRYGGSGLDKHLAIHDLSTGAITVYDFASSIPTIINSIALSNGRVFINSNTRIYVFDLASRTWLVNTTLTSFTGIGTINGGDFVWSGNPDTNYLYFVDGGVIYQCDTDTYAVTQIVTSADAFLTGGRLRLFRNIGDNLLLCRRIPLSSATSTYHITHARGLVTSTPEVLGDIVEAECVTSNLLATSDVDVTELTDTVRGYRVSSLGAIRAAIEPLRAAWPFDVVQHGYKIKFKMRGSASIATITAAELDARAAGAEPGVRITDTREMDLQLPQKVTVKYLDVVREYDTNEQFDERVNTDAVNETVVEIPIVLNADEAKQTASTLLYLYWMERYDIAFNLPPTYAHLEPADVITIEADNATYEVRLVSVQYMADGRIECRARYNSAAVYTQVSQGEDGQSTGDALTLTGPSIYKILDIPLMRDDDDTAGFPVAMTGYNSGWPGGVLYRSDDGGQTWVDLVGFESPGSVIGYAIGTLPAHGGTVYDFANRLTVRLYSGSLSSVTEAQLFAGQNWFAYGTDGRWEIIAARSAVLQGDGSYILSDFLRGQKGTEWATGLHVANDAIVLLDTNALNFVSVNSSTIGSSRSYRGITSGETLDSDSDYSFSYDGVNLECLSPVALTGNRNPSTNDWTLTWVRRSRYGDWRDYVDAPLGEASASYVIEIYSSSAYTTLKRTLTATSETVAYTSAQQVTDFGSNQATLYLKIYQVSATVGNGYALTFSITR